MHAYILKLKKVNKPFGNILSSQDVFDFVKTTILKKFKDQATESFGYLGLSQSHEIVVAEHGTTEGGSNESRVYIATIAKKLLLSNCSRVIFFHNHPSGNLKVSDSDIMITDKLKQALGLFEIQVLDHVILAGDDFTSFKERGLL